MAEWVRVAVVGDSSVYRQQVAGVAAQVAALRLCASASTLSLARQKLAQQPADLVLLDARVAGEEGLSLLPWLRAQMPAVQVVLMAEAGVSLDVMMEGVIKIAVKPTGPGAPAALQKLLQETLMSMGIAPVTPAPAAPISGLVANLAAPREVVAVGASTGGPPVVTAFICGLPASFAVPVMITQHMPREHVPAFVASLAQQSGRPVRLARHLTPLLAGEVVVAGDGRHMRLGRRQGQLVVLQDDGPEEHYCRPAVNPLFASVAATCGAAAIGVIMTGMGSDGAKGAARLAECGAPLVVQDKQTSAVWGMPGAVVAANLPCQVVPAPELCHAVMLLTHGHKRGTA